MNKVLFCIPYLYGGGSERALSNITTHFPDDWDIDILCNSDTKIGYEYRGNIISLGCERPDNVMSIWFQFKVFLKRCKKLRELKKQNGYKACISFIDSANIANVLSGKKHCKVFVSVRTSLKKSAYLPQYKYIVNPLARLFYNHANQVIAVSEGVKKELIEYVKISSGKITVIRNGYDIAEIENKAKDITDEDIVSRIRKHPTVINVGRLDNAKGQWHLIRAFNKVLETIPEALLVIVGDGGQREYLDSLIDDYNLKDKVIITGFASNPFQYVDSAKVFVMSSIFEGYPNALCEAICLGIPCIAADFISGAREIIAPQLVGTEDQVLEALDSEYGIIIPNLTGEHYKASDSLDVPESIMADAIIDVLQNEEKREQLRQKSMKRRENLSINSFIDEWMGCID